MKFMKFMTNVLLLHFGGARSRKGGEVEAISPSRTRRQGIEMNLKMGHLSSRMTHN